MCVISSYISQVAFKFVMYLKNDPENLTLHLRSVGITGMHHHTQFIQCWGLNLGLERPRHSTNKATFPV